MTRVSASRCALTLEQYQGAPASRDWLRYYLVKSTDAFGDTPIGDLDALTIARWRAGMLETMRQGAHRALRQVLATAVRWRWINHNIATDVPSPMHALVEFDPVRVLGGGPCARRRAGPVGPSRHLLRGHGRAARGGLRRRLERRRSTERCLHGAQGVREGAPEGVHEDRALATPRAASRQGRRRPTNPAGP